MSFGFCFVCFLHFLQNLLISLRGFLPCFVVALGVLQSGQRKCEMINFDLAILLGDYSILYL